MRLRLAFTCECVTGKLLVSSSIVCLFRITNTCLRHTTVLLKGLFASSVLHNHTL